MSSLEDKLSKALSANEDSNEGDFQKYAKGVTEQKEEKSKENKDFDFEIPKTKDVKEDFDFDIPKVEDKIEDSFDFGMSESVKEEPIKDNFDFNIPKAEEDVVETKKPLNKQIDKPVFRDNHVNTLDKETISDIITIYEEYKEMDGTSRQNLSRFLNINTNTVEDTIYGILNVNPSSIVSIEELISLFNEEPVSRVFTIVSMDNKQLKAVENALKSINNRVNIEVDVNRDKIGYCKKLEEIIRSTPESVVNLLKPVEKILKKGN